jgi:hypothetical protein
MEYNFFTKFGFKANLIIILWTLMKFEKIRTCHNFKFQCDFLEYLFILKINVISLSTKSCFTY